MKLAICGPGSSGKDLVGEILRDVSVLQYTMGTSRFAADLVYDRWGKFQIVDQEGTPRYDDADDCWEDRRNHRGTWARIIGDYNRDDPVQLYRDCLAEQDLLTGIRWRHEMQGCKAAGLVDLWIWIKRDGCQDSTMEFTEQECDLTICNNGTIDELKEKLIRLSRALGVARG